MWLDRMAYKWGPLAQSVEHRAWGWEITGSDLSRVGGGFTYTAEVGDTRSMWRWSWKQSITHIQIKCMRLKGWTQKKKKIVFVLQTIFEVNATAKTVGFNMMKKKRQYHQDVIHKRHRNNEIQSSNNKDLESSQPQDHKSSLGEQIEADTEDLSVSYIRNNCVIFYVYGSLNWKTALKLHKHKK